MLPTRTHYSDSEPINLCSLMLYPYHRSSKYQFYSLQFDPEGFEPTIYCTSWHKVDTLQRRRSKRKDRGVSLGEPRVRASFRSEPHIGRQVFTTITQPQKINFGLKAYPYTSDQQDNTGQSIILTPHPSPLPAHHTPALK